MRLGLHLGYFWLSVSNFSRPDDVLSVLCARALASIHLAFCVEIASPCDANTSSSALTSIRMLPASCTSYSNDKINNDSMIKFKVYYLFQSMVLLFQHISFSVTRQDLGLCLL